MNEYASLFSTLVKERTGLSFSENHLARLMEAVRCRMSERGLKSHREYHDLLNRDRLELIDLVNLLTVNETYFYREPVHLRILSERLIPEMLARKGTGSGIRILSAGCSTGEEPYSILMAVSEKIGPSIAGLLRVSGVDIDSNAVARARKGVYGGKSFRTLDPCLKTKYFEGVGNGLYRVKEPLTGMVDFQQFNLSLARYPESFQGMDVVFYRNVSIYFDAPTQRKIFEALAAILSHGGYLITSSTETLSHNLQVLSLIEMEGMFLYRKVSSIGDDLPDSSLFETGSATEPDRETWSRFGPACIRDGDPERDHLLPPTIYSIREVEPGSAVAAGEDRLSESSRPEAHFNQALRFAQQKCYSNAMAVLDRLIDIEPLFVNAHVLKANMLANLERLEEAEGVCLRTIELDPLCIDGYLLLGLIAKIKRDDEKSSRRFKQALYIRSSCWVAHFYLGEVYYSRGETEKARREYGIVMSLAEKGELTDPGLTLFSLSIPVEQIVRMCRFKLAGLT